MTGNNSESSMQRIYVGGLTATVSEADVKGRFQPFGDVIACELAKSKVGDPSLCRGFAYVNFIPKDQAALSRVFSLVSIHSSSTHRMTSSSSSKRAAARST
jgi:RNA recognition motif-containing protein